ncbi:hypothetical protein EYF80_044780 [Liparis tanakae]|uniref:Uncharacterized protein n=1 Tax=Liparis tanakae TaxID=230148 RepID=A0A4Z2FW55_9TELE|nr:hypothetical protein EYF80_044780 [Liparis tanakae]
MHYCGPVDAVRVAPAAVGVRVSVPGVDEGVFERSADVVGGQAGHRRHHVARKLPDAQRAAVLPSPPWSVWGGSARIRPKSPIFTVSLVDSSTLRAARSRWRKRRCSRYDMPHAT